MVDTAGKKLKQARLRKQLSLEDVARATKIRVPRLAEIENDDYTNFPSMAYVRGFLVIYAKYLGIDISEYTETLGSTATSVAIGDYEYLSNAPERIEVAPRREVKRSFWPLLLFVIFLGIGVCAAIIYNFILNAQRLPTHLEELGEKHLSSQSAVEEPPKPYEAGRSSSPEGGTASSVSRGRAEVPANAATASVTPTPAPTPEVRRAELAHPEAAAQAVSTPALAAATPAATPAKAASAAVNEVVVKAVKKTWVQIFKDDPASPAVYEDWLYPDTFPLRLKGARFYIKMSDVSALKISKNGVSQPIDQPAITIQ